VGGSTGTNLWGAFGLIGAMRAEGVRGSVVTLICDGGERYTDTYYSDDWVTAQGLDLAPHRATIDRFLLDGIWPDEGQRERARPA
jgi:cysteine synthase A